MHTNRVTIAMFSWIGEKINFFSEYGHVAYQIKENEAYNNILAYSLPLHTPLTLGWGQKVKHFSFLKVAMLHIKIGMRDKTLLQANSLHICTS